MRLYCVVVLITETYTSVPVTWLILAPSWAAYLMQCSTDQSLRRRVATLNASSQSVRVTRRSF